MREARTWELADSAVLQGRKKRVEMGEGAGEGGNARKKMRAYVSYEEKRIEIF